jgi:tRNA-2-methylthio-N6-dimethylallyladenosine synthase
MEKIIEEKNQGIALQLDKDQKNTRNLYIESYGCYKPL